MGGNFKNGKQAENRKAKNARELGNQKTETFEIIICAIYLFYPKMRLCNNICFRVTTDVVVDQRHYLLVFI